MRNPNNLKMKLHPCILLLVILSVFNTAVSQVTGTKTVPGDYPTIAAAVADVSANGISGNVQVHVQVNHTEVAPAGGVVLKFQGSVPVANRTSASQTLTIQRNGVGLNPRITAQTGTNDNTSLTAYDGVFLIVGVDHVTIYGIDIAENPANITAVEKMEMGYGILRESGTNGSQNLNFRDCQVTLDNSYSGVWGNGCGARGSVGFFSGPMSDVSTTLLTVTSTAGANSNLNFYRNTVEDVQSGFFIMGFADASPYTLYDQSNVIGNSSGGNNVFNFKQYGVFSKYQDGLSIFQNLIDNDQNGAMATSSIYGVYNDLSVDSDISISENVIQLVAGGYDGDCVAVYDRTSGSGTLAVADNYITLQGGGNNLISFSSIMRPSGYPRNNITITGNWFADFDVTYGAITQYFFFANLDNVIGSLVFQANSTAGNIDLYSNGNSNNYCYFNSSASMSSGNVTVSDNFFDRITRYNANNLGLELINDNAGIVGNTITKIVENNVLRNIQSNTGDMIGFRINYGQTLTRFTQNLMFNCSGATNFWGANLAGCNVLARYNVFRDNSSIVQFKGIYLSASSFGSVLENEVYNISVVNNSSNPGPSHGIYCENFTAAGITISKNKVHSISVSANSTTSQLSGIEVQGVTGAIANINNNLIAELSVLNATGPLCLYGIQCRRGDHRVYYNTVALGYGAILTTASANFGVVGVSYNGFSILDLRNNIIYVNAQQKGAGVVSALQRAAGASGTAPANFAATSGYNIYYAPNAANSFLYSEGVNAGAVVNAYNLTNDPYFNSTNCSTYKSFMGGVREDSTATELPPFIGSGSMVNKYSLTTGATSYAESGGQLLGAVADDHTGTARPNNGVTNRPDIGFEEFTGVKSVFLVCDPLPVELLSFNASVTNGGVLLEWSTASEQHSSHFYLEKSMNGADWEFLVQLDAAGNSTVQADYSFLDRSFAQGVIYYRLTQVDLDGMEHDKGIRSVELSSPNELLIIPNPSKAFALIIGAKEVASFTITDLFGRILLTQQGNQIDSSGLSPGKYLVICHLEDGEKTVADFIKE